MDGENKKLPPGQTVASLIHQIPESERPAFLAVAEQQFRLAGDLEMLREIKAYRRLPK